MFASSALQANSSRGGVRLLGRCPDSFSKNMYSVKEIYYTLQGEGVHAGRAAVFLRFTGCNLWDGKEEDREKAICRFCDTQFVGTDGENGGKFKTAYELADAVRMQWPYPYMHEGSKPFVVCTGGEPMLQLDKDVVTELHLRGFEVAIETNGTIPVVPSIDWICVSPKAGTLLKQITGNELKLVYPQPENKPKQYEHLKFDHFFLSPRDCSFEKPGYETREEFKGSATAEEAIKYCLEHPKWKLSLQTHKMLGLK